MVDQELLDRLLDRVASDLKVLDGYRAAEGDLLDDPTRLAGDVDDGQVRDNLERLTDLDAFVSQVAAWSGAA